MDWCFDISKAPKGHTETLQVEAKGKQYQKSKFVPEKIILACRDGKTVTVSHWIPGSERWCMLASGEQPIAWMPYPSHPEPTP